MGNNEAEKTPKSEKPEKPASPPKEPSSVHVYPDWAAVQAYYGAGGMPAAYYNPAAAPGHAAHPYMWAPQMVPPYGSPYAAMYPHGGIYGASTAPAVATPQTLETPTRSSGNDNGSTKKPKETDLNAASGNGNESAGNDGARGQSHSTDCGTDGSCDRSDGSTAREDDSGRSYNGASDSGTCNMKIVPGIPMGSTKPLETFPVQAPQINHSSHANSVTTAAAHRPSVIGVQDERELKREKRKQSNRESARRSRLRKQAEMEDLGRKVDALTAENLALRSEINKLEADSEKLRSDNGLLVEKLKKMQGQGSGMVSVNNEDEENSHINTENLLEKVDNSMSNGDHEQGEQN
ncbi:G-box-binding factor 3-like isoform X2 [Silene latifolia]|uniref:G-box-binding factor 3-like isoform X2 n=1 Tax=Silene latifolia TaxID=37657 RepID=UPI003D773E0C